MSAKKTKELIMISLDKGIELYLATMETEGKSPRYVDWLKTRLQFFGDFLHDLYVRAGPNASAFAAFIGDHRCAQNFYGSRIWQNLERI